MASNKLRLPEVRERVNRVIEGKRDFVYNPALHGTGHSCVYFKDDAASCLVGRALESELRARGVHAEDADLNSRTIGELARGGMVELTKPALAFLADIQSAQDVGIQWGQAVEDAERLHGQRKRRE